MSKYEDISEDEVTCPYCGYAHSDSWEFGDEDEDYECPECFKKFAFCREVSVSYRSIPDCELNNEKHNFEFWKNRNGDCHAWFCKICGKCVIENPL